MDSDSLDSPLNSGTLPDLDRGFLSKLGSCFCFLGPFETEKNIKNSSLNTIGDKILMMNKIQAYFRDPMVWCGRIFTFLAVVSIILGISLLSVNPPAICGNVRLQVTDIKYYINRPNDVLIYDNIKLYDVTDNLTCTIQFTDSNRFVIYGYNNNTNNLYQLNEVIDVTKCTDNRCFYSEQDQKSIRTRYITSIVCLSMILLIIGIYLVKVLIIDFKLIRRLKKLSRY